MPAAQLRPFERSEREWLLLSGQVDILAMIARDAPMAETLTAVIKLAETLEPAALAGVTIVDRVARSLEMAIFPSLAPTFANAVASGEIVTIENLRADTRFNGVWRQLCEEHGIRSCRSRPVRSDTDAPLGTFMLCFRESKQSDAFDDDLIEKCAKLVEMTLERRRTRERRELMVGELQHRVRNVFASVGALAHFSAENAADVAEFSTSFRGRLNALNQAHSLMFNSNGVELSMVLRQVLEPYGGRTAIAGPRIFLAPEAASSLSMAFHELATNAAKYGSLSNDAGTLSIAWDVTTADGADLCTLNWVEEGGPAVSAPTRHGFGSRAVERLLASEIEGRVRLDFAPQGLRCEITAPLGNKIGRREQILAK